MIRKSIEGFLLNALAIFLASFIPTQLTISFTSHIGNDSREDNLSISSEDIFGKFSFSICLTVFRNIAFTVPAKPFKSVFLATSTVEEIAAEKGILSIFNN